MFECVKIFLLLILRRFVEERKVLGRQVQLLLRGGFASTFGPDAVHAYLGGAGVRCPIKLGLKSRCVLALEGVVLLSICVRVCTIRSRLVGKSQAATSSDGSKSVTNKSASHH